MFRHSRSTIVCCLALWVLTGVGFPQQQTQFESLLASAQQAQVKGDLKAAAEFYRKAVGLQPEIPEVWANLGLMYYQTGKDQQAIDAFLRAIQLKPNLFVPNLFLGLDYVRLKRFDEAIPYLKRAALINPKDLQAKVALGQAYKYTGKTRLAITSYIQTVQVEPGNAKGWFDLGVAYLEQVEANARILLKRHKESGYLHALVADTFAEQKAFIQAAEAYKTALASQTFPSGTHAAYGFVLLCQHDFTGADRELNAELKSNPGSLMAKLGLARLQIEQGETKKGVNEIVRIWKSDANFLQANASVFNRGLPASIISQLRRTLEESRTAGEVPEEVVSLLQVDATGVSVTNLPQPSSIADDSPRKFARKPFSTAAGSDECADPLAAQLQDLATKDLRRLASCAYFTGRFQAAFEASQKLALSPATEAEGLYWETRAAQKLATEALARASATDSNSSTLHVLLGDLFRQRKYYPDAEQEYRKALAIHQEDAGALLGLSLTLLADSEIDEALHFAEAALKTNPDDPEFNAVMGEILSAQHDFARAEPCLKKALKTKPELVPHVHALLGRVYAETNRTQQAIAELKMGLADDKDGRLHFQIARLYLKVGDQNSAKQAFQVSERLRSEGLTRAAVAMQQGENNADSQ